MPSIIPGYEYDIFISYRQIDYLDGWATEFVNSLKNEVEATFKEDISIYFDENPQSQIEVILERDIEEIGASKQEKWYLMAGYQASLGMYKEAIESFNKSIEYGFKGVFEARHNSLLDPLKDNPEFQEIMTVLEKTNSSIREQVLAKGYFD